MAAPFDRLARGEMIRLAEEILLLVLDDEHGDLSLAWSPHRLDVVVAAALLMDLALEGRIDTDLERLFVTDSTLLDDDLLDPVLADIVAGPKDRTADFWLARTAESGGEIRERVLSRLVERGVLETRAGSVFLSRFVSRSRRYPTRDGRQVEEVRLRLMRELFDEEIPDPRDLLLICLSDASGLLDRLLTPAERVQLKDRIELIRQLDLLGRSLLAAVSRMRAAEAAAPVRPSGEIPAAPGLPLLGSALSLMGDPNPFFASQHRRLGPIFRVRAANRRFIVLAGPEACRFLQSRGRAHLRSMNAWRFVGWRLGTSKFLFALDGSDHARLRKLVAPGFSVQQIRERMSAFLDSTRRELATWPDRGTIRVLPAIQRVTTRQALSMFAGASAVNQVDDPRFVADLDALLETAVTAHLVGPLPRLLFMRAATRRAGRRLVALCEDLVARNEPGAGGESATLVNDLLETHRTDSQFISEEDLPFHVASGVFGSLHTSAVVIVLALYQALKRPGLLRRMKAEADALFGNGAPEAPSLEQIDITHRFLMETLRVHPLTTGILRRVSNSFSFAGYSVPAGADVLFAVAATHRLEEHFREPGRFDIERFGPERAEHRVPGVYVPFGVGAHSCVGKGFAQMQTALTLAAVFHDLDLALKPPGYRMRVGYRPGIRPPGSFRVVARLRKPDRGGPPGLDRRLKTRRGGRQ